MGTLRAVGCSIWLVSNQSWPNSRAPRQDHCGPARCGRPNSLPQYFQSHQVNSEHSSLNPPWGLDIRAFNRSVIVTGGTINLGYQAALNIAKAHPDYLVVISSRSDKEHAADAINNALKQKNVAFIPLDLASSESALVLNAGLQFPEPLQHTAEGLESTFAINHTGHALLFHLLCGQLVQDGSSRVVLTSSGTHDPAQKSGLPDAVYISAEELAHPSTTESKEYPGRQRYASSKLANVMWAYALNRHLREAATASSSSSSTPAPATPRVTVNAMDPALMPRTGLAREASGIFQFLWTRVLPNLIPLLRFFVSPNIHTPEESGAALSRLAIGSDVEGVSGKYFEGLRKIKSSEDSYDVEKQEDLWNWTVKYAAAGDTAEEARFRAFK
ncbi:hypothetical protein BX600DRAFT_532666 [Xylariales sp. PMI_506]|nr:hypothetical protein BX600DRAFT_532666 [Xylariales sp. PMI_506]